MKKKRIFGCTKMILMYLSLSFNGQAFANEPFDITKEIVPHLFEHISDLDRKSVWSVTLTMEKSSENASPADTYSIYFNQLGLPTLIESKHPDTGALVYLKAIWSNNNRYLHLQNSDKDDSKVLWYEFDQDMKPLQYAFEEFGITRETLRWTYGATGRLLEVNEVVGRYSKKGKYEYWADGKDKSYAVYVNNKLALLKEWDEFGRPTLTEEHSPDDLDRINSREIIKYLDATTGLREIWKSPSKEKDLAITSKLTYSVTDKSLFYVKDISDALATRYISESTYGETNEVRSTFSKDGKLIRQETYSNGKFDCGSEMVYDNRGMLIRSKRFDINGIPKICDTHDSIGVVHDMKYDIRGNWTYRLINSVGIDGKKVPSEYLHKRKIVYRNQR